MPCSRGCVQRRRAAWCRSTASWSTTTCSVWPREEDTHSPGWGGTTSWSAHTHMHAHTDTDTHIHARTHTDTHIHARTHTDTHMHMHTHANTSGCVCCMIGWWYLESDWLMVTGMWLASGWVAVGERKSRRLYQHGVRGLPQRKPVSHH